MLAMPPRFWSQATMLLAALIAAHPAKAKSADSGYHMPPRPTYADLADLADSAPMVIRAQVKKLAPVGMARAPGLRPGWGRFYIEAKTRSFLYGQGLLGESLKYLVDLPLDKDGRAPDIKKRDMLLFARAPAGRPGELQLVAADAQIVWDQPLDTQLRGILGELHGPDPAPRITGLREAIYVGGTLAGEGETQVFLSTANDSAASITITHRPGSRPVWSVSFSEVVVAAGNRPAPDTLGWYRLACFLPPELPRAVNLSATPMDRTQAELDYRIARREMGTCPRTRR